MSGQLTAKAAPAWSPAARAPAGVLQRACECGAPAGGVSGKCEECAEEDLLGKEGVQAKLSVSTPDDPFEREADAMADQVTGMTEPMISRAVAPAPSAPVSTASLAGLGRSAGLPLGGEALSYFEPRFGRSLDHVRIHDDGSANGMAQAIGARAFTHRHDIYFADGEFDPRSQGGRHLLAHEITHVFQQGAGGGSAIQRQPAPRPPAPPTRVTLSLTRPIPVPPSGSQPLRATTDARTVTWSVTAGSAQVAAGTGIDPTTGVITVGAAQTAGTVEVRATDASGAFAFADLTFCGKPTGISNTFLVSDPPTGNYGHVFDHDLISSTGTVGDLEGIPVGEKFPGIPTPNAANHLIPPPTFPFGGSMNLHTATLTPGATNNWFVTGGNLGGNHDTVSIGSAGINVGMFVQSASNPSPAKTLPVDFTIDQHLHWFNVLEANAANRWRDFITVPHKRGLVDKGGGSLQFETTVNQKSDGGDDYVGKPAVSGLTANPASIARSAGPPSRGVPAPPANTVALSATTLPSPMPTGRSINWTFQGARLGCSLTPAGDTATLTIGRTAGTVTIRAADNSGTNFDQTTVTIT